MKHLRLYKELSKLFIEDEESASQNLKEESSINFNIIGILTIKTPNEEDKVFIARDDITNSIRQASLVKLIDGKKLIIFEGRFLDKLISQMNTSFLFGVLAHEVGHLLCKHFEENGSRNNLINVRDKQGRYLKLYETTKEEKYYNGYMNATLSGIIKGGIFDTELEADLEAIKFVGKETLIAAHIFTMADMNKDYHGETSRWADYEKMNRLKYIASDAILDQGPIEGYKLDLQLFKV